MLPLSFDIRSMYRKHVTGQEVSSTGVVTPTYTVNGPYRLAFRPGGDSITRGESGYTYESPLYLVLADGCDCFKAGDILTPDPEGNNEQYRVELAKTFPTQQNLYVREI